MYNYVIVEYYKFLNNYDSNRPIKSFRDFVQNIALQEVVYG